MAKKKTVVVVETKTMSQIWGDWWKSVCKTATAAWKATREIFSSSFYMIKNPIIALVTGIYDWCKAILFGVFEVLKSFVVDFLTGLCLAIWDTIVLFFEWLIAKIKKW